MAGPPMNISPADLWVQITQAPRPHRVIDFPRMNREGKPICQVVLFVLTPSEQVLCASEAEKECRRLFGEINRDERGTGYNSVYDSIGSTEMLFRSAYVTVDGQAKFFPSSKAIRDVLTTDEVGVLISAYVQMSTELGPIISQMSDEEQEAWLSRLADGAAIVSPLYLLTSEQKNDLLKYSARQLLISRKVNISPGLPVDEE